jgi:hypothetical protein
MFFVPTHFIVMMAKHFLFETEYFYLQLKHSDLGITKANFKTSNPRMID